jgi:NADH-quinone oxidoreductase subunit H
VAWSFLPGPVWFLLKSVALMYFFVWERATYPRLRIDQILRLGWKVLMPIALANLVVTAIVLSFLN